MTRKKTGRKTGSDLTDNLNTVRKRAPEFTIYAHDKRGSKAFEKLSFRNMFDYLEDQAILVILSLICIVVGVYLSAFYDVPPYSNIFLFAAFFVSLGMILDVISSLLYRHCPSLRTFGMSMKIYRNYRLAERLRFIIAFAIVAIFALIVIGLYWLFSGYFENLWQSFV